MPSDPQRIQTVFLAAAEIHDPAERARFLDGACDAELKSRVEALLHAHDQPDSLLDHPADALHDPDTGGTRTFGHEGGAPADGDEAPLPFLEPSSRPDSLGRIGHYEILQILGRGGFGIVFRAFDEVLQRVVALKVLAPAIAATSPARKRFLREARSSAQVRHENVVQVHAVEEQPLPYLVMEFIPGETLQQRLDRVGPLEAPEIVRIGRQIAEGLAAAHATDLIHRDIKPANVLLEGGHQRVKITDFGLARAADDASLSQSGVLAGTPMYMAPEQAKGEKIDCRADLFSLGSVLYVMCSGRPPFRASSTFAVLKRVVDDAPRPIREVIPETPQWLCDIIAKLHAKKPEDRFQSAREVADVFADCEVQLKANAKVQDFSRIPQRKPAAGAGGRWKWIAAAALLLPVLALATTEMAGITHLFGAAGRQQPTPDRPKNGGEVPGTPLVPATANDLPLVSGGSTDLIPFARPDLSSGRWESHDGKLVHPARDSQGYPGLTLAVRGPDDFDLEAEFERTSGDDFIAFGMSSRGHLFCVALDTWGQWAGLQAVAGELSNANPTRRMGPWLTTGRRHTFRCEVRALGVRAWLDAREVVDYRGGYDEPGLRPARPSRLGSILCPGQRQLRVRCPQACPNAFPSGPGIHQLAGDEIRAYPGRQVHDGIVAGRDRPLPPHAVWRRYVLGKEERADRGTGASRGDHAALLPGSHECHGRTISTIR